MPKNSTTAVSYPVCHGASHSALVQGTWRTSSLASKLAGLKAYLAIATGRVCRLPMGLWKTRRKLFVSHQSSVELLMFVVLCNSLSCWFKHSHGAPTALELSPLLDDGTVPCSVFYVGNPRGICSASTGSAAASCGSKVSWRLMSMGGR